VRKRSAPDARTRVNEYNQARKVTWIEAFREKCLHGETDGDDSLRYIA